MSRLRPAVEQSPHPAAPRLTRSAASQARLGGPGPPKELAPGPYGKQRRKHTDSALAQDLSQMRVSGQESPLGHALDGVNMRHASRSSTQNDQPAPSLPVKEGPRARVKSSSRGGLASVARLLKLGRCKNIVVVAGAGISTASGIPDFRTPGTGLYSNLERYDLPYPEAVFNIDYFSECPQAFFSLARELYPGHHRPNYIHYFIRSLHLRGLLLRVYTQNIDGLEKMCGIPEDKLVEAHGNFTTASCHLCYTPYPAEDAKVAIMSGDVPTCSFCAGTVKPDVVFFGEDLPQKYFLHSEDFPKADLLIIMGTSLQIEPFASLVNTVRASVPRLLLNRHAVGPFLKTPLRRADHLELGDLLDSVQRMAHLLGWSAEIEELMRSQGDWVGPPTQSRAIVSRVD
ncbi:NAD-dependent protein deacetylase sirtuin-3 [Gadus macrocephalus]|uniref:NAD-dependent protein deacetylase sirtuin-3 n=1 Tax=Gadus macrocephalus TaxID=80720 RepID=UPI0028CBA12D|nr:NAD-dependent protein deacetylase sirtuin-3 [Gadus macrocephalus]XP_059917469.1 NAD-dependent protein deacetylase sirtuin-3 [Gadus macrocephalus]